MGSGAEGSGRAGVVWRRRSKRGSSRFRDNGVFYTGEGSGADGVNEGAVVEAKWWVNRVNPNITACLLPLYSFCLTLSPVGLIGHSDRRLSQSRPVPRALVG
jgi:hypothetical protein